jgi:hypothetical protein
MVVYSKAVYRRRRLAVAVLGGLFIIAVAGVSAFVAGSLSEPSVESTERVAPVEAIAQSQPADTPGAFPGLAGRVDVAWANQAAEKTGIPVRAVQSYAGIAIANQKNPSVIWAGIPGGAGHIESRHGVLRWCIEENGQVNPPSLTTFRLIATTVRLTNAEWDRAVGPMADPQTWRNWGTDGNSDGLSDPQNTMMASPPRTTCVEQAATST